MECYSEQTCALAVDGELAVDEALRLRDHLATCRRCRELVDALRAEESSQRRGLRTRRLADGGSVFNFHKHLQSTLPPTQCINALVASHP